MGFRGLSVLSIRFYTTDLGFRVLGDLGLRINFGLLSEMLEKEHQVWNVGRPLSDVALISVLTNIPHS